MDRLADEKKKLRNKAYYEANKARILKKRAEGASPTRKPIPEQPRASQSVLRAAPRPIVRTAQKGFDYERAFLATLVIATTFFLIREIGLYLNASEGGNLGLVKALLGEGIVIALSWFSFSSFRERLTKVLLLIALLGFNVWTLSGSAFSASDRVIRTAETLEPKIAELEKAISTKELLFADALARSRKTLARQYEQEMAEIRHELNEARAERLKLQSPTLTRLNLVQSVLFRLILMSANILLVSQMRRGVGRERLAIGGV